MIVRLFLSLPAITQVEDIIDYDDLIMSSSAGKLSFTIRRPTPTSRASSTGADSDSSNFKLPALPRHLASSTSHHHTNGSSGASSPLGRSSPKPSARTYRERDSSDEDEGVEDELVTGFDQFGVQRCVSHLSPLPSNGVGNSQKSFFHGIHLNSNILSSPLLSLNSRHLAVDDGENSGCMRRRRKRKGRL